MDERPRYPWERALLLVVLYGALLVFLWYFPSEGGRTYFRTLLQGLLYFCGGTVLIAISLLLVLVIVLPASRQDETEPGPALAEGMALKFTPLSPNGERAELLRERLEELQDELHYRGEIIASWEDGVVAVAGETEEETALLWLNVRNALKEEGIRLLS